MNNSITTANTHIDSKINKDVFECPICLDTLDNLSPTPILRFFSSQSEIVPKKTLKVYGHLSLKPEEQWLHALCEKCFQTAVLANHSVTSNCPVCRMEFSDKHPMLQLSINSKTEIVTAITNDLDFGVLERLKRERSGQLKGLLTAASLAGTCAAAFLGASASAAVLVLPGAVLGHDKKPYFISLVDTVAGSSILLFMNASVIAGIFSYSLTPLRLQESKILEIFHDFSALITRQPAILAPFIIPVVVAAILGMKFGELANPYISDEANVTAPETRLDDTLIAVIAVVSLLVVGPVAGASFAAIAQKVGGFMGRHGLVA